MIKNKKCTIVIVGIIFIIMSTFSAIMSDNILHTDNCNIKNCQKCAFINMANNFNENNIIIVLNVFLLICVMTLLKLIKINITKKDKMTLVDLKVIQIK